MDHGNFLSQLSDLLTEGDSGRTVKAKFTTIRLIHVSLLMGMVMFGGVVMFSSHNRMTTEFSNPVLLIAAMMCVGTIVVANIVRRVMPGSRPMPTDPASLIRKYQVICLVQWALLEGGGLFAAVVTMLTGSYFSVGILLVCIAALAYRRPSERDFLSMFSPRKPFA